MRKCFLFVMLLVGILSNSYMYSMQNTILGSFSKYLPTVSTFLTKHRYSTLSVVTAGLLVAGPIYYYRNHPKEERWDWEKIWEKIDAENIEFPKGFLRGGSISAFQYEGTQTDGQDCENSWTEWEKEEIAEKTDLTSFSGICKFLGITKSKKQPRIPEGKRAGHACGGWTHYKEDAKLLSEIGMNTYRLSIEWAKVETSKGVYDDAAIQHYIEEAKAYLDNGIIPIFNLWHHTFPTSIYTNNHKVGFENPETKKRFVEYALHVLRKFKEAKYQDGNLLDYVKLWLTFNEPIGYALAAHVDGKLPPGEKFRFIKAGIVAKNMLDAHIEISKHCKRDIDDSVKFSIAHVMTPVQPYNPQNPVHQWIAQIFDNLINDVALEYFKTGKFNWLNLVKDYNPDAIGKLDFLGVNYYTRTSLSSTGPVVRKDEEKVCADGYADDKNDKKNKSKAMYAEGLYQILQKAKTLGVPILITENGCAAQDTSVELRDEYFKRHLYVIQKAIQERIDVRGYLVWTGFDCFGWNSGQHSNHGIYKVDFETQKRTPKRNAEYLVAMMKKPLSETLDPIEPITEIKKNIQ